MSHITEKICVDFHDCDQEMCLLYPCPLYSRFTVYVGLMYLNSTSQNSSLSVCHSHVDPLQDSLPVTLPINHQSASLTFCQSDSQPPCLPVRLPDSLPVSQTVNLPVSPPVCQSVCLSVNLLGCPLLFPTDSSVDPTNKFAGKYTTDAFIMKLFCAVHLNFANPLLLCRREVASYELCSIFVGPDRNS